VSGAAPKRQLPAPSADEAFFWRSGADGKLRVKRCPECSTLLHPSAVVCPDHPRSVAVEAEVSGRAHVLGLTVNHQQWLPGFEPPYTIAIVGLDEDPSVRLTTNIVGDGAEAVGIGDPVEVRFEQCADDVWVPVFAPAPGPALAVEGEVTRPTVRPPASAERFESKVALTGIGMSEVGRRLYRPPVALAVEACLAALEDAGLERDDIDGLSTYPGAGLGGGMSEGGVAALEEALRIRPTWHNGAQETPGQTGSVVAAMLAVSAGLCRHVLCFRTVWEATHTAMLRDGAASAPRSGRVSGDMQWRLPYGAASAACWIGMQASNYFHRYGATRETLGWIALNARRNAALNPTAVYRDPLTMDDYLSARMVTTPFGLYDCDVPCDGAVAVIVSAADAAKDLRSRPVRVAAVGTQIAERHSWDQGTMTHEPMVLGPAAHLWTRTELTPADVDVALLYDGFTFNCLSWLEGLGFCGIGEAPDFLDGGRRIALDGELPLNPHGGQLSAGRLHGYGFLHEAIVQLRGDAGQRQVRDAEVAVVASGGGVPGGCLLLIS